MASQPLYPSTEGPCSPASDRAISDRDRSLGVPLAPSMNNEHK